MIDDSLNAEQMVQPDEGRIDNYEGQGGAVVNAADGLDPTNIASVDKAIVSFSTSEVNNIYNFNLIVIYLRIFILTRSILTSDC